MGSWLEIRTLNRENPSSNPFIAISELGQFFSHFSNSLGCINEYLAIDGLIREQSSRTNGSVAECVPEKL